VPKRATVAQVVPVLLLAAIFEMKLLVREADEPLEASAWVLAFFAAMLVAEMSALLALSARKAPTRFEDSVILMAIYYGVAVIVLLPLGSRYSYVRDALPWRLGRWLQEAGIISVMVIAVLVSFGMVNELIIGAVAGAVVIAGLIGARGFALVRPLVKCSHGPENEGRRRR